MTAPLLLRGVDGAAFAVALVDRLHRAGVAVSAGGATVFVDVLRRSWPRTRTELYWAARLTLVHRADDLPAFDAVFGAVFGDTGLGVEPPARSPGAATAVAADRLVPGRGRGEAVAPAGLPWTIRPASVTVADGHDAGTGIPDTLPSRFAARVDEPFDRFDPDDLRLLGDWLEQAVVRWPRRRSMRREPHRRGKRVDLRESMRRSRVTGWETLRLVRSRSRAHPRRVVLLCDVSHSMQPYSAVYLQLMRAAVRHLGAIRPEVFAFATSLTRLTPALAHRSAEVALARANVGVTDRYGGTRIGGCVGELLSGPRGTTVRGAVVIVASDGWDSDPPEVLERALARLRRRAHTLVWLNPRAASPDYRPLAASMAAALPYCDHFLPAHSLAALKDVLAVLAETPKAPRSPAWRPCGACTTPRSSG